ncbi:MAG TPA: hypothetical protein VFO54_09560, partial [Chryseosolibacter sp.]|nr:hypothetical protein [Chryseosolibacter sp.]
HPVWHNQDPAGAREVLARFKEISNTANAYRTSLDRDLMKSLDLLYGEGDKTARDKAYADNMATLFEKYKDSEEVAAFYALSLLGLTQGWNTELCNRAAEISAAILKGNPTHPGALHYFIHAKDHPEFANQALQQANDYSQVASYSGHALHMPSHIYLALGVWDDVVGSNEVSWRAGIDRKKAKALNNDALNYHAHWWLEYGYLQQGRFDKAEEILKRQLDFTRELPSRSSRTHVVIMRGHYLLETNDWDNKIARETVKTDDMRIEVRTLDKFVNGLIAYRRGNQVALQKILDHIERDLENAIQSKVINADVTQCGASSYPEIGITQASILKEELMALQSFMKSDVISARAHFKKATDLEEQLGHFFGPPEILKPTHELYGEFLLAIGQPDQAIANFEIALQKAPGRNQALAGLSEAARLAGDVKKEKEAAGQLKKNLMKAESRDIRGFFKLP